MSIQEWPRGCANRTCCQSEPDRPLRGGRPDLFQFFKDFSYIRKQTDTVRKEFRGNFSAASHHFLGRCVEAECLSIKLDREPVIYPEHFAMIFAAIIYSMLGEQFPVDLVPPRLGIGEHAIQIENDGAEGIHSFLLVHRLRRFS